MPRNILLITTDQMRYDALGCNGGAVARTPVLDGLAKKGFNYNQMIAQNVVCMPARASIITGQYPDMHGVWMNGVPLPLKSPSVAHLLNDAGYKTALVGKAHFEPWLGGMDFYENSMAQKEEFGPHRGFDYMALANHFILGNAHYDVWLQKNHPELIEKFYPITSKQGQQNHEGGGESGAVQCWHNDMPRELYHTDWVANNTIDFLEKLAQDDNWFVWMSFPDPHHPWDPPASELDRIKWQDLDLPNLWGKNKAERVALLKNKPHHWLAAYEASINTNYEMPPHFVPASLSDDNVREINAMTHIENELIDEACGNVINHIEKMGQLENTDIFFTTDHGEMQGDFGLMFKGPFHVNALMHLPLLWAPAAKAAVKPENIDAPVGHIDLAPTFCKIAGIDVPDWMQGDVLPISNSETRERALTFWESVHTGSMGGALKPLTPETAPEGAVTINLKTITRNNYRLTLYGKSSLYDGSNNEGELYDLRNDPEERENLWNEEKHKKLKTDLIADMLDNLPQKREKRLERIAPV